MNIDQIIEHLKANPSDFTRLISALPKQLGSALAEGDVASLFKAEPYAMEHMVRAEPYAFAKRTLLPDTISGLERALAENSDAAARLGISKILN